ncbi:uncharacterized protein METZ01_LOCUS420729, partial [marine metagenome]
MKLLRYGPLGSEKPGLLDDSGAIRALSTTVGDITGATISPDSLKMIASIDPYTLPRVVGDVRIGPCIANVGKFV